MNSALTDEEWESIRNREKEEDKKAYNLDGKILTAKEIVSKLNGDRYVGNFFYYDKWIVIHRGMAGMSPNDIKPVKISTHINFIKTPEGTFRATSPITGEIFGIGATEEEAHDNLFKMFNEHSEKRKEGAFGNVIVKKYTFIEK